MAELQAMRLEARRGFHPAYHSVRIVCSPPLHQVEAAKKEQFKSGQALYGLRQRERELINEISGAHLLACHDSAHLLHVMDRAAGNQAPWE